MTASSAAISRPVSTPSPQMVRAYLALLFGVCCLGFSAIWGRAAIENEVAVQGAAVGAGIGLVVAVWRVSVASLALLIPFLHQPAEKRPLNRRVIGWGMLGGAFFAADVGIWNSALAYTNSANATFLGSITPILVGLFTLLVLHERLPQLFWPGMALAIVGMGLMIFSNGGGGFSINQGDVLVIVTTVFWAGYQLVTRRARGVLGVSTLTYLWMMVTTASLVLTPIALLNNLSLFDYQPTTLLTFLAAGLISQTAGYIGINYALGHLPTPRVSATLLVQPMVTAILAWLLLGEVFGGWPLLGGVLIVLGVYLVNRSKTGVPGAVRRALPTIRPSR